jgi:hypothetical protein
VVVTLFDVRAVAGSVTLANRRFVALFLVAGAVWAMAGGLSYVLAQQRLRADANDPQVQLAEDGAAALNAGAGPASIVGSTTVDVAASLAPWVTIYGQAGDVLASNATLYGTPPQIPSGVRAAAAASGRDQVTWEPSPGVRVALVVVPFSGGTVASGRSLRLVEMREDQALLIVGAAVGAGLVVLAVVTFVASRIWPTAAEPRA